MVEARENETIIENKIKHIKSALIRAKEVVASSAEHNEENTEGKSIRRKNKTLAEMNNLMQVKGNK